MNARDIQRRLMLERYRRSLVCPNYTPRGWFECDVFELTKAGYFREYEIKLSTADFRADKNKYASKWTGEIREDGKFEMLTDKKHDLIAAGSTRGPSKFWFVAPVGIIPIDELPTWAGLIECREFRGAFPVLVTEVRPAPQLHREKADLKIKSHVDSIFYYRFSNLFIYKGRMPVEAPPVEEWAPKEEPEEEFKLQ